MAILRRCCCCFSLRRGTVTLGVMGFTGAITAIITLILAFIYLGDIARVVVQILDVLVGVAKSSGTSHLSEEDQEKEKEKLQEYLAHTYSTYVLVIALIGQILGAVLAGLLIWGAVKKRRNFLLPWLIFAALVMLGAVICIITCLCLLPWAFGISFLVGGIVELLVMIYFWLVVFSFYQELREREQMNVNSPAEMKRLTSHM